MITKEKLKIYLKYGGDGDAWARSNFADKHAKINDNDWALIDNLIQDLTLIENKVASETYIADIEIRINEICDGEETKQYLKTLVKTTFKNPKRN